MTYYQITIDFAIPEFRRKIDPAAELVSSVQGEQGDVCRILQSRNYRYYISWINETFRAFSVICKAPGEGHGQSINKPELLAAKNFENSWIVIASPKKYVKGQIPEYKDDIKFYGLSAKDWYNYTLFNPDSWHIPNGRHTFNTAVPIRMLRNMEGFNIILDKHDNIDNPEGLDKFL